MVPATRESQCKLAKSHPSGVRGKPKPASRVKEKKIAKPRPQQKIIKSRTQQHKKIPIASARIQNESVANLVEKAFRGY